MNWYRIKKARLDKDALYKEAQPFLDSGAITEADRRYELHWYEIVGTDYEVYAEEDADPDLEGMHIWNVIRVVPNGEDEIIDYAYSLADALKKYSPSLKPVVPAESLDVILEKLYDIGGKSDPRAAPWLEKYRKMTGEQFPKFMY